MIALDDGFGRHRFQEQGFVLLETGNELLPVLSLEGCICDLVISFGASKPLSVSLFRALRVVLPDPALNLYADALSSLLLIALSD